MEYWIQMNKQYIVLLHKHLNNNNTTQNPFAMNFHFHFVPYC
jgi:hypothetical protein